MSCLSSVHLPCVLVAPYWTRSRALPYSKCSIGHCQRETGSIPAVTVTGLKALLHLQKHSLDNVDPRIGSPPPTTCPTSLAFLEGLCVCSQLTLHLILAEKPWPLKYCLFATVSSSAKFKIVE